MFVQLAFIIKGIYALTTPTPVVRLQPIGQFSAVPFSSYSIEIAFLPPDVEAFDSEQLRYRLRWRPETLSFNDKSMEKWQEIRINKTIEHAGRLKYLIRDLDPDTHYRFQLFVEHPRALEPAASKEITAKTFPEPGTITLLEAGNHTLSVAYTTNPVSFVSRHTLEYREVSSKRWIRTNVFPRFTAPNSTYRSIVRQLKSNTRYVFRVTLIYVGVAVPFRWPGDDRFVFRTGASPPHSISAPEILVEANGGVTIEWSPLDRESGARINEFALEMNSYESKLAENDTIPTPENWTIIYTGTRSQITLNETVFTPGNRFEFRAKGRNKMGWGMHGDMAWVDIPVLRSMPGFDPSIVVKAETIPGTPSADASPGYTPSSSTIFIVLASALLFVVVSLIVFLVSYVHMKKKKWRKMKAVVRYTSNTTGGHQISASNSVRISTPLPYSTVERRNELYMLNNLNNDLGTLPRIRRDNLKLSSFLGSGAFAEVYEGELSGASALESTKVAVKMLKKTSTVKEIEEFLKEAKLVHTFRHPHIVQLIGICLDMDPFYMVFELLQGGDLLSFLRTARCQKECTLTMPDLLDMCLQVAGGCAYLEQMHFVHRDIAARNCLISTKDANIKPRIIKIGDFGLARDIYRNDYYRKEGEGLLPVRWMPPESLVDGIFTIHSDVWAFGVVMWEIMTLGQQPYPARSNLDVYNFVRNSGRLEQPPSTSDAMCVGVQVLILRFDLMQRCWRTHPEERPCFRLIIDELETMHGECELHHLILDCYNPATDAEPAAPAQQWASSEAKALSDDGSLSSTYIKNGAAFDLNANPFCCGAVNPFELTAEHHANLSANYISVKSDSGSSSQTSPTQY